MFLIIFMRMQLIIINNLYFTLINTYKETVDQYLALQIL